jgi:hypothetical protein
MHDTLFRHSARVMFLCKVIRTTLLAAMVSDIREPSERGLILRTRDPSVLIFVLECQGLDIRSTLYNVY